MSTPITIDKLPPPLNAARKGYPWTVGTPIPSSGVDYPKISIVTPSYNQALYLEETIRSVLLQSYPNLEYIVIDGGSQDDSIQILEYYSDFITYWVSEKDEGQTDAINKGFSRASGEIMGWLNSDDILLPNALQTIAKVMMKNPNIAVVTGWRKVYDENTVFIRNLAFGLLSKEFIRHLCAVFQETTYWRREVYEKIGALKTSHRYAMDYQYWQRMLEAGYEFTLIPQYLGGFRIHETSKGETLKDVRILELNSIYQEFAIASNEFDAASLYDDIHPKWRLKVRFLRDLGRQSYSNHAWFVWLFSYLLQKPVISDVLLELHYNYMTRIRHRNYLR